MNSTSLEIGYQGVLQGKNAEVVGRASIRNSEGYRWEEYYVKLDGKDMVILVYERGDWKWFEEYKPDSPMEVATAETYAVGDTVQLGFRTATVSYVGRSTVTHAEGQVLEGVHLGSEADYFNATVDNEMLVVSWTGLEIEFYMGSTLPKNDVQHAFGLPEESWTRKLFSGDLLPDGFGSKLVGIIAFVIAIAFLGAGSCNSRTVTIGPPPVQQAQGIPIALESKGILHGKTYTVVSRWKGEIDEVGRRYVRYEYELADDQGGEALLVQDQSGSPHTWMLFTDMGDPQLTPEKAATYAHGASLALGTEVVIVDALFLSQTIESVGKTFPGSLPGSQRYGFRGSSPNGAVMARWDSTAVRASIGHLVPESDVMAAFPANAQPPAGK